MIEIPSWLGEYSGKLSTDNRFSSVAGINTLNR